jgi:hypothetical protein
VLAVAASRPPDVPCRLKAQRRRNTVQDLRRERPAKAKQHASLVEIDLRRRPRCERADHRLRRPMRKSRSDRSNAPPQPTDGARQRDVGSAERIGSGLHALGRRCDGDAVFDRGEQARQPGGQEVRQEAERSAALRAVPPGDPQPSWRRPGVTSMTGKRAATRRVQGAAGQSRVAPFPVPDVRVDTRQCSERKLQRPSPARRRITTRRQKLSAVPAPAATGERCPVGPPRQIKSHSR